MLPDKMILSPFWAVHKLCRLKISNIYPLPLLAVFLLSKIGNFDPPPLPMRGHSLWMAPYCLMSDYEL